MRNRQGFVAARLGIRGIASLLLQTLSLRAGGCARFQGAQPWLRTLAVNSLQSWLRANRHGIVGKGAKL